MAVTLAEVARRAGVSEATASRALNGRPYVSAEARARVEAAARDLNFVPHLAARTLSMARTWTVALLVHQPQYPSLSEGTFGARVLLGASRALRSRGYDLLYSVVDDADIGRLAAHSAARSDRSDGILLLGPTYPPEAIAALVESGRPVVLVDNLAPPQSRPVDAVLADNLSGSRALVTHLVADHGYRRIAFVGGPPSWPSTAERLEGYRSVLEAADLPPQVVHLEQTTIRDGRRGLEQLQRSQPLPDAIVAANDAMATGILRQLRRAGSRGTAVVGFDDTSWARLVNPALTTVAIDGVAIGATAAHRLVDRIEGRLHGEVASTLRVPARLRIRASCGCTREEGRHPTTDIAAKLGDPPG